MDISIINYDKYKEACENKGIEPQSEEDIIEEIPYAAGCLRNLKVGETVTVHSWNDDIKEYYECKRVEEDVCEIKFVLFMA